jgi:hypothetical protein
MPGSLEKNFSLNITDLEERERERERATESKT